MIQNGTHKIGITIFPVKNTKAAAMLLTLGVPFAGSNLEDLASNVYCEGKPYKPGMPGEVSYQMAGKSAHGVLTSELLEAFEQNRADLLLDKLADEIAIANPALGNRLKKLLPLALATYARGFYENRERILDLWKHSRAMVLIHKSEKSFVLIPRNASAETRRHYGV